jgi:flagellar protein FlaG
MPNEPTAIRPISSTASASGFGGASQDPSGRQAGSGGQASAAPDYRLVIEEGPRPGVFVYKTVDRSTGETIRQFPREELVKLSGDPRYVAGQVASTRA